MLSDTAKQQNNGKEKIESKKGNNNVNSCHADSIEINKMDELLKSHVESDQHDKDEGLHKSSEEKKSDYVKKQVKENISDVRKIEDSQSYMSDNYDEYDDDNYDECYGKYSSEEGSMESTFEDWFKRKAKCKHKEKHKSYSD